MTCRQASSEDAFGGRPLKTGSLDACERADVLRDGWSSFVDSCKWPLDALELLQRKLSRELSLSLGVEAGLDVAAGMRSLCVWALVWESLAKRPLWGSLRPMMGLGVGLVWDSLCPMMAMRLMGTLWRTLGQYAVKTVDVNYHLQS